MVRPEQPWSWPLELVGSSARAGRWKGAAWNMYRRIWGCSPWKELDRDGLSEEIDDGVCGSIRGAEGEIGRDRELAERRSLASSVAAWRAAWGAFYRQGEAVERGTPMAGRCSAHGQ